MDKDAELELTRRRMREIMGKDYGIDLTTLDVSSILELRRLLCDVELMTWQIRKLAKPTSSEPSREAKERILGLLGNTVQR
jgi:hypothetical protein